jgi:hypothetical protein
MSALGQKQTFAVQKGMSALPPIADIGHSQCAAALALKGETLLRLRQFGVQQPLVVPPLHLHINEGDKVAENGA